MSLDEHTASDLNRIFCYSYLRCAQGPQFYIALHQQFEQRAADFLEFCSSNDLNRQRIMLEVATSSLLQSSYSGKASSETNRLARTFTDLGISLDEKCIKSWQDSLLGAVCEIDPLCNDLILAAWRRSFFTGIDLFRTYQQEYSAPQKTENNASPVLSTLV